MGEGGNADAEGMQSRTLEHLGVVAVDLGAAAISHLTRLIEAGIG